MHFSFLAVNENADENEIPFSAEKRKRVTCAYITELSYASVAKITFSALCKWQFRNENEKQNKNWKFIFRPKTEKSWKWQIAQFRRRKRKRISVGFQFDGLTRVTWPLRFYDRSTPLSASAIHNTKEPQGLRRSDGKRPDGLTLFPWQSGRSLVWDVSCLSLGRLLCCLGCQRS